MNSIITRLTLLTMTLFFMGMPVPVAASTTIKTVGLPITLDYSMLRTLIVESAFVDEEESLVALHRNNGCQRVTLSNPQVGPEGSLLRITTKVDLSVGTSLLGACLGPVGWQGSISAIWQPRLDDTDWALKFKTVDSTLAGVNGGPARLSGFLWHLVKEKVHKRLDEISVDISKPVSDLKKILPPLFPDQLQERADRAVGSMRFGDLVVGKGSVRADIIIDMDTDPVVPVIDDLDEDEDEDEDEPNVTDLSPEQKERVISAWEKWDAFLVRQLNSLESARLDEDDRQEMLDVLLESRIRFVSDLEENRLDTRLVWRQFVSAWKRLSPVIRGSLHDAVSSAERVVSYLSFFTASDALVALDKNASGAGIEVGERGLLRIAELLNEGDPISLDYVDGTDDILRSTLGLGAMAADKLDTLPDDDELRGSWLGIFSPNSACASAAPLKSPAHWLFSADRYDDYVARLRALIDKAAVAGVGPAKIPKQYHQLYRHIITAIAWQESCFRQFNRRKGKIVPLISYNNTSVGVMQIHLRVWRGVYDAQKLRWDISYNAKAGAEIAGLYLVRYGLRKMNRMIKKGQLKKPFDHETLARLVYAMYNGGPRHFWKFQKRLKRGRFYKSDRLYYQKYKWTREAEFDHLKRCLVGSK